MIVVDANILLYAENSQSSYHKPAQKWWDAQLSGTERVGLSWIVLSAYIRIGTNPRVFERPLSLHVVIKRIQSWLDQPCTQLISPTTQHWNIFQKMLRKGQATANLVTDAHLAALTIEHGGVMFSSDADFSRFPGLKWKNPLA